MKLSKCHRGQNWNERKPTWVLRWLAVLTLRGRRGKEGVRKWATVHVTGKPSSTTRLIILSSVRLILRPCGGLGGSVRVKVKVRADKKGGGIKVRTGKIKTERREEEWRGVEVVSRFQRLLIRVCLQGHPWWFGSYYFLLLLRCTKVNRKKWPQKYLFSLPTWNRLPLFLGGNNPGWQKTVWYHHKTQGGL